MVQLIAYLVQTPRYGPPAIGKFKFSNEHGKYIYLGRALTVDEFNDVMNRIVANHDPHVGRVSAMAIKKSVEPPTEEKPKPVFKAANTSKQLKDLIPS